MANWWTLKIISGPNAGKEIKLRQDRSVVGRSKGDVVIEDTEISSVHAEFVYDSSKGMMFLNDLKSRNGTKVNGQSIVKKALNPGDKIKFGTVELVVEAPASEETAVAGAEAVAAATKPARSERVESAAEEPKSAGSKPPKLRRDRPVKQGTAPVDNYLYNFKSVVTKPGEFFEIVAYEDELKPALIFAAVTLLLGTFLSFGVNFFVQHGLHMQPSVQNPLMTGPTLVAMGMSFVGLLIGLLIGLPIAAVIFHVFSFILGGRGKFKKSLQVACYVSAIHVFAGLLGPIPKAGEFLQLLPIAYTMYALAVAATRVHNVGHKPSYIFCSIATILVIFGVFSSHRAADKMQGLVKLNELQNALVKQEPKDAVVPPPAANAPVANTDPTPPAPQPDPQTAPDQQRDPAANPDANANSGDPQPPSNATQDQGNGDPQPPSATQ